MKTPQGLNIISKSERINFFTSLFQNSPMPKTISSISTKNHVFVNTAWENFTGFSKEEAIGKTAFDLNLISLESGKLIREKLLNDKEIISYECTIQLKSGKEKRVLMSFDTIFIKDEAFVLNTINNLDDLQVYKEQDKILVERTEELLIAKDFIVDSIENMADGFVSLNKEWVYTYVNKKASKMLGRKPKELIGKHIWTEFPEGVNLPFYKKYHKAAETQQPQYIQEYYPPFDSWFENRIYPSPDGLTIFFTDITQRKKVELALQESENHIKTILETEPECIKQLNAKGELIYMNPAGLAMIEADNLEMVKGNSVINLISPNYQHAFKKLTMDVFKGNSGHLVFEIKGLKGTDRWLETHAVPLKDSAGNIISLLGITRDITKRKHADKLLIQKEQELNAIYSSLVQPIFMLEVEPNFRYKFISVNKSFLNTLGVKQEDVINKNVRELIPEPSLSLVLKKYKTAIKTKNTVQWEETTPYKTGLKTAMVTISPLLDSKGICTHLIGLVYDISESKNTEVLLKENEKSLIEAQKLAKIGNYNLDLKTGVAVTSNTFKEIVGLDINSEVTFDIWRTITHPEDIPNNQKVLDNSIKTGKSFVLEYRIITKNKKEIKWIEGIGEVVFVNGEATNFFGTIQDITLSKTNEIALNAAKDFSENLISSMQEGLSVVNLKGVHIDVNPALCKMTGFSRDELIGKKAPFPYWPPEEHKNILKMFSKPSDYLGSTREFIFMRKNGERFQALLSSSQINDKNGNISAFFATIKDITELKKVEFELKSAKDFSENLISSMQNGLSVIDFNAKHIQVNPALCKMTGYSEKELLGIMPPFPYWPPEYYDDINDIVEKAILGAYNIGETVFKRKSGERFPVQVTISNVKDDEGNDVAYFATVEDISLKVKAREELKAAKEFSDKLIMSMQEGLIIVNLEGKILMINDSTCKMLGYSEEELTGMTLPYPFARMEDFEEIGKTNEGISDGEKLTFHFEFVKKSGEKFLASFSTGNIKNDKGEVIALFGTMKDITEEDKVKKTLEDIAVKSIQKKDVILELSSLVGSDYHKSLRRITALSATTLNVARVGVWKFIEGKTGIICEKLYVVKTDKYEEGILLTRNDNPNYFDALAENLTIDIEDAVNNEITKGFAKNYLIPFGISSMLDVFIQGDEGAYGVICFEHIGKPRIWTADDQEFATSIASIVSLMVESTQRKVAENKIVKANKQLTEANKELSSLRIQLENENVYLRNELDLVFNYEEMVYGSAAFSDVLNDVEKVAPTNATVLLLGESGTGKELLARAIHNISSRNKKPLIKVNCAAIPRELIESELFGHKKGSFTGAFNDKVGKFELADQGTLFLDEIGELPLDMQPKILRFLQEGEIEVVGGIGLKKLDVRVIAATNRNLKEEIEKKQFREDLYFRLNVFPIETPPLRKRIDDIPLLVEHFIDKFNKAYAKDIKYIPEDSMNQLKSYSWPGNIRELENLIERASILSTNETLFIPGFESKTQNSKSPIKSKSLSLDLVQRNYILKILEQCNWKISGPNGAAVMLDLKPSTLRDKMAKLDISKLLKK